MPGRLINCSNMVDSPDCSGILRADFARTFEPLFDGREGIGHRRERASTPRLNFPRPNWHGQKLHGTIGVHSANPVCNRDGRQCPALHILAPSAGRHLHYGGLCFDIANRMQRPLHELNRRREQGCPLRAVGDQDQARGRSRIAEIIEMQCSPEKSIPQPGHLTSINKPTGKRLHPFVWSVPFASWENDTGRESGLGCV